MTLRAAKGKFVAEICCSCTKPKGCTSGGITNSYNRGTLLQQKLRQVPTWQGGTGGRHVLSTCLFKQASIGFPAEHAAALIVHQLLLLHAETCTVSGTVLS